MGGSTKKVETAVKRSSIGQAGAYIQDKGSEVVEGAKEHGGAIASGISKMGQTIGEGIDHNLKQVHTGLNMLTGHGPGGGDDGETASAANYSTSANKGKAAGSAEGRMGKNRERLAKRDALKVRK